MGEPEPGTPDYEALADVHQVSELKESTLLEDSLAHHVRRLITERDNQYKENIHRIAAQAAAETERDQLRAENELLEIEMDRSKKQHDAMYAKWVEVEAERDRLQAEVERLRAALSGIRELADDELRRLGAVPGSNVAQIEANAVAALGPQRVSLTSPIYPSED